MDEPLTMAQLADRLGQAERAQVAAYIHIHDLEREHRDAIAFWKEAREVVAEYAARLDRFVTGVRA